MQYKNNLRRIDLSGIYKFRIDMQMENNSFILFCNSFINYNHIEYINFSFNNISDECKFSFTNLVEQMTNINTIYLINNSNCRIENREIHKR